MARRLGSDLGRSAVMSTTNSWYAVVAGRRACQTRRDEEEDRGILVGAEDTFLSRGRPLSARSGKRRSLRSWRRHRVRSSSPHGRLQRRAGGWIEIAGTTRLCTFSTQDRTSWDLPSTTTARTIGGGLHRPTRRDFSVPSSRGDPFHWWGYCCTEMKVLNTSRIVGRS